MVILKILFILLNIFIQDGKWIRVNTNENISFLFPNNPQKIERTLNNIPSTIYQTKDLICVAGIVCSDMSAKKITITHELAQRFYEELKAGTLNEGNAILKNEYTIDHEGILIKEIEYSILKNKHEMTYFKRFIFRNNFIYQITIGGQNRYLESIKKEREIFFNSITFTNVEKQIIK